MRIAESLLRAHVPSFYFTVFWFKINVKETCSSFSGNVYLERRLDVCPVWAMNVASFAYCTDACLYYTNCLAVNYLRKESICEMLDTTKESKPIEKFKSAVGSMYTDVTDWIPSRKNNACIGRPCASGQRCVPNKDTYLCQESVSDHCLLKYLVSGICERVPDSGMRQSSYTYLLTAASYGRLESTHGWCAGVLDREQYIQIRFQRLKYVKKIVTRGKGDADQWVKTFKLLYSTDCISYEYYRKGGKDVIFQGNRDRNTTVYNDVRPPIRALCVRLNPWSWKWQSCMRVDLLGCSAY